MQRREKTVVAGGKVVFAAIEGRQGGRGIFGLEEKADERARHLKLLSLAEEIAAYDRGYVGAHRRCPRCGQEQRYKGDVSRDLVFDCGTLTVQRAYYICPACRQASYPLDEQLGLVEEQGCAGMSPILMPSSPCVVSFWNNRGRPTGSLAPNLPPDCQAIVMHP